MSVFEFISMIIAGLAVWFSFRTVRLLHQQTTSAALLACLEQYFYIARLREQAISKKSERLARLYYREMLDLLWTEFRLWHSGLIPGHVMEAWLHSRFRNYRLDRDIKISTDEGEVRISYKGTWEDLKGEGYFHSEDPFVPFMDLVHEGKFDHALNRYFRRVITYLSTILKRLF